MSWEGHEEGLCLKGHFQSWSSYGEVRRECVFCQSPLVQYWGVDETNGCGEGWVDGKSTTGRCFCGTRDLEVIGEEMFSSPLGGGFKIPIYAFVPEVYEGHRLEGDDE